jgi:hypothetical protein
MAQAVVDTAHSTRLTEREARSLTEEAKRSLDAFLETALQLYEGGAHLVLGHASWETFARAEFGFRKTDAYRKLDAARVMRTVRSHSPNGEQLTLSQARALASLKDDEELPLEALAIAKQRAGSGRLNTDLIAHAVRTVRIGDESGFVMQYAPRGVPQDWRKSLRRPAAPEPEPKRIISDLRRLRKKRPEARERIDQIIAVLREIGGESNRTTP